MRFLFLNQYGPPDPVPTARLLGELAEHLRGRGHEVEIVSQSRSYHGRPARGGSRLRREVAALGAMLRVGWRKRTPRPDIVLSLTSPPGLLVVAAAGPGCSRPGRPKKSPDGWNAASETV